MAESPRTDTAPGIPLLAIGRIVALVAPTLASPPGLKEKEERDKQEFGALRKLYSALPAWADAVRNLGLAANIRVNEQDVFDGQRLSCTLADGSTRAKVPLPLVRSLHVSTAVPRGLDVTKLEQLHAIKFDGVDMRSVDILPPVKHLVIHQCRNVNEKLSNWFGVCAAHSPCETGSFYGSHVYARKRKERAASANGWPRSACATATLAQRMYLRWLLTCRSASSCSIWRPTPSALKVSQH
jgi:hypothetical protein